MVKDDWSMMIGYLWHGYLYNEVISGNIIDNDGWMAMKWGVILAVNWSLLPRTHMNGKPLHQLVFHSWDGMSHVCFVCASLN